MPTTRAYWSANHRFVLRLDDDLEHFRLMRVVGKTETQIWKISSPVGGDEHLPGSVYIPDNGKAVIFQDHYGFNRDHIVLIFLGQRGQVLKSFTLNDLFSTSEVAENMGYIGMSGDSLFQHAVASLGQSCAYFGYGSRWGKFGVFDVSTGLRLPPEAPQVETFRAEMKRVARRDLAGRDVQTGMEWACALRDKEFLPALKHLLSVSESDRAIPRETDEGYNQIQIYAGYVLAKILGRDAAPLIEKRLRSAMADHSSLPSWLEVMQDTGEAANSPLVLRCSKSEVPQVRTYALVAVIENGGIAVVRRHPEWIHDSTDLISTYAAACISKQATIVDLPLLRRMLSDPGEFISHMALRGMIRLKPPGLNIILHKHLNRPMARMALAEQGDAGQLRWTAARVNHVARIVAPESADLNEAEELPDMVRLLVHYRPPGTSDALLHLTRGRDRSYNSRDYFKANGCGGLAALGDHHALNVLRDIAEHGKMVAAVQAIEWLAVCRDYDSVALLRSLLKDRPIDVIDAARSALKAMNRSEKTGIRIAPME